MSGLYSTEQAAKHLIKIFNELCQALDQVCDLDPSEKTYLTLLQNQIQTHQILESDALDIVEWSLEISYKHQQFQDLKSACDCYLMYKIGACLWSNKPVIKRELAMLKPTSLMLWDASVNNWIMDPFVGNGYKDFFSDMSQGDIRRTFQYESSAKCYIQKIKSCWEISHGLVTNGPVEIDTRDDALGWRVDLQLTNYGKTWLEKFNQRVCWNIKNGIVDWDMTLRYYENFCGQNQIPGFIFTWIADITDEKLRLVRDELVSIKLSYNYDEKTNLWYR